MADTPDLWNFATRFYAVPGVAPACLSLQDRHGADVMVLLCCLWTGNHFGTLNDKILERLCDTGKHWQQQAAAPLRRLRRRIKPFADTPAGREFYEALKQCELAAEALEGQALTACLDPGRLQPPAGPDAARHNAGRYLARLGAGEEGSSVLDTLLHSL